MLGHLTYLVFEIGWAFPVIALQWAVAWRRLRPYVSVLVVAVLLSTLYLSAADGFAISQGIWTLHADRILGIGVANLPLEEIVFFLLTNLMVVQSVLLLWSWTGGRSA